MINPALTKPIVAIVVTCDDWTSIVSAEPREIERREPPVKRDKILRRESPASILKPSVDMNIPRRKSPMPPAIFATDVKFIVKIYILLTPR